MTDRRTVFPIFETLLRRSRLVFGLPLLAAGLATVAVLLMRPTYAATASFVAENPTPSRLPAGLSGLASQLGVNLGAAASRSPAFYADLMRSREILGEVLASKIPGPRAADSVTVYSMYSITGSTQERRLDDGLKSLRARMTLAVDPPTAILPENTAAPLAVV